MTLCPSARRPGVARRNAHTPSSSVRHSGGNSRHVVFALTTAVGHSAVRSIVTSYAIPVLLLRRRALAVFGCHQGGRRTSMASGRGRFRSPPLLAHVIRAPRQPTARPRLV